MRPVWRFFFGARGRYSTVRGRTEHWLFRHSTAYRRFYDTAVNA